MSISIGRIVVYTQPDNERAVNGTREHPAIVTRVWGPHTVSLHVFFDNASSMAVTSVSGKGTSEDSGSGRTWHFAPRVG